MSGIFGALNVSDTERAFVNTVGQAVVFDAVNDLLAQYNAEVSKQLSVFVERETEKFKLRYLLPGSGQKLQQMGRQAPAGAMKRYNKWDVALPLRQWGAQFGGDEVDMAYMTLQELDAHLDTIMISDLNTMRWRILTAIFEDTNLTFTDPIHGDLTVRRLANTDSSAYPPILGSESDADDQHYLANSYAVAAIADDNNPAVDCRDEIAEHFGGLGSDGRNFVYFASATQTEYMEALTDFTEIKDQYISGAVDTEYVARGVPNVPGRMYGRTNGVWLSEWDGWIPDNYGICVLLDVSAPLLMRVDPGDTGLPRGLTLRATDEQYPLVGSHYTHRFGLGCGNRLSAAVIEVTGDASYAPPSAYSE